MALLARFEEQRRKECLSKVKTDKETWHLKFSELMGEK